ncbi:MAG: hypothetical protein ACE14S_02275 [Candidatus Bathyarchaeia archaeon]
MLTDYEKKLRKREYDREYNKTRRFNTPEKREKRNAWFREYYHKKMANPENREKRNEYMRNYIRKYYLKPENRKKHNDCALRCYHVKAIIKKAD